MSGQLVAIDIGNTNVHVGIGPAVGNGWTNVFQFPADSTLGIDDWTKLLAPYAADSSSIVCSSVVPALTDPVLSAAQGLWGRPPLTITSMSKFSIVVATDQPGMTGADRSVNANTAWLTYGGPAIVIDSGTATKVDAVSADGRFLGGAIAPGLTMGIRALSGGTAQLPTVPLSYPESVIGTNTADALRSGVVRGHVRMIEGLVSDMRQEIGEPHAVVLTGGAHPALAPHLRFEVVVEPHLTLDGLRLLAERS